MKDVGEGDTDWSNGEGVMEGEGGGVGGVSVIWLDWICKVYISYVYLQQTVCMCVSPFPWSHCVCVCVLWVRREPVDRSHSLARVWQAAVSHSAHVVRFFSSIPAEGVIPFHVSLRQYK